MDIYMIFMASDLELVHLTFNQVKELSLIYGDLIPHLIFVFQQTQPRSISHILFTLF